MSHQISQQQAFGKPPQDQQAVVAPFIEADITLATGNPTED
ncbi:hypothetical protein NIES4073_74410 [Kalymmatonema gypsitolerans NIES-4073]|jgi:hypothetical protein|nr:hypothetical protein NIES4073_74410 [Scytonema sp. NIES-4073]